MKTMIAILTLVLCATASAQSVAQGRKTIIQCTQTEPYEATEIYNVRIEERSGKAANWIQVYKTDASTNALLELVVDQLINNEKGSIETGEVVHLLGAQGRLTIEYPYGKRKLNFQSAVFVGKKNSQAFAVPMKCTHL